MKTYFQPYYFDAFYILLLTETAIALFLKSGFIRHTFGDFLVVILLYCFIKSFIKTKPIAIALIVLLIAYAIEFLQLYNILDYIGLRDNKFVSIVLGTSFSIEDLIAYSLGVICMVSIDLLIIKNRAEK